MLKLTRYISYNNFIWQAALSFSVLMVFTDNKCFDSCGFAIWWIWHSYYLLHLIYLCIELFHSVLFEMFWNLPTRQRWYLLHLKYPSIQILVSVLLEIFCNLPMRIWNWLNYTKIRWNLSKNRLYLTPWLVHWYISKGLWQYFWQFF